MTSLAFNLFVLGVDVLLEYLRDKDAALYMSKTVDERMDELIGSGILLKRHLHEATEAQREAYLDALERLMAAAQSQIQSERGRG